MTKTLEFLCALCATPDLPPARVLLAESIDPHSRLFRHRHIEPESLGHVRDDFSMQQGRYARYIAKELDTLLRAGGTFDINLVDSKSHSAHFLSRDQVKYEFAVSTNGRYALTAQRNDGRYLRLSYKKQRSTLAEGDRMERWTFGVITNGKKNDKVVELVQSILAQGIPECEILICGPFDRATIDSNARVSLLPDVVLPGDVRFPIGAKKNRIIAAASHENVCILHDRFVLPPNWYQQMRAYGNYFDYLCFPTTDAAGNRFNVDWMQFVNPPATVAVRNRALRYDEWSTEAIIQGGIILGKRTWLRRHRLDERLHWEELEDIHLSKVAYLDGAYLYLDCANRVISAAVNHQPQTGPAWWYDFKDTVVWRLNLLRSRRDFRRLVRRFGSA